MNLFATILTYPAPTANYRGESELNRAVIQKITDGRLEYPIISPEAMRNALRETLAGYGLPANRTRLHDEEQLAVTFEDYPDPERFADDFFFGYLVAASGKKRTEIKKDLKKAGRDPDGFVFKRDSVVRMNLAKGLEPYRHGTVFTQSPKSADGSAYANDKSSNLLHRETADTAFQFPLALNLDDCRQAPAAWNRGLLKALGELNGVAGNHARSYYEFAPASLALRLTESLVAGYETYAFRIPAAADGEKRHRLPNLIPELLREDGMFENPAEFRLAGQVVRDLDEATADALKKRGVTLDRSPQRLLAALADELFPGDGAAANGEG